MSASSLQSAATGIVAAVERDLIVPVEATRSAFVQRVADPMRPLDVQALGLIFLTAEAVRTHRVSANLFKVRNYLDGAFKVTGRTIAKNADSPAYDQTYSSTGSFTGYRPYAEGGPDVLWAQVRVALRFLGERTSSPDPAISAWGAATAPRGEGPLGADRTVTGNPVNEYHVWPTSAAAGWALLGAESGAFWR